MRVWSLHQRAALRAGGCWSSRKSAVRADQVAVARRQRKRALEALPRPRRRRRAGWPFPPAGSAPSACMPGSASLARVQASASSRASLLAARPLMPATLAMQVMVTSSVVRRRQVRAAGGGRRRSRRAPSAPWRASARPANCPGPPRARASRSSQRFGKVVGALQQRGAQQAHFVRRRRRCSTTAPARPARSRDSADRFRARRGDDVALRHVRWPARRRSAWRAVRRAGCAARCCAGSARRGSVSITSLAVRRNAQARRARPMRAAVHSARASD